MKKFSFLSLIIVSAIILLVGSAYVAVQENIPTSTTKNIVAAKVNSNYLCLEDEDDMVTIVPRQGYMISEEINVIIPEFKVTPEKITPYEYGVIDYSWVAFTQLMSNDGYVVHPQVWEFLDIISLEGVDTALDLGAGGLTLTFAMATKVKSVYASDLTENFIRFFNWKNQLIENKFYHYKSNEKYQKFTNIIPYVGELDDAKIPEPCDLILLHNVHAFREFPINKNEEKNQIKFLQSIIKGMKDNGRIVLVDFAQITERDRDATAHKKFLQENGLKVTSIRDYPHHPTWFIITAVKK